MGANEPSDGASRARRAIRVQGTVQGVGMRPWVYRLAREAKLAGFVRNDSEGVWIEIEGDEASLARFPALLEHGAPRLARIEAVEVTTIAPRGEREFRVVESGTRSKTTATIPADAATCDACLGELFDPRDRRYRYPFINCTDCGPRFTIVRDVPYDRAATTMGAFVMCARCLAEYDDPANRRFHAEPNACPLCGPRAALVVGTERVAEGEAAVERAVRLLDDGGILALKGLGGYQLAVRASDERGVATLRARKRRPHKPFALMARDLAVAARVVVLDEVARAAMTSAARPVVLAAAMAGAEVAPSVAPRVHDLGVMLPSTPLHHLLLARGAGLLVMTSGNLADEPIAKDDDRALAALAPVADAFLVHDRAIHTRADDSVVRVVAGAARPVRRARGFAPDPIALGFEAPAVLAVGAHLKSTMCITRGAEAFVSQHIGDLDGLEARAFFEEVIAKMERLLGVAPTRVAHDLHPDYASTRWALASPLPRIAVQHHHAHVASCLAEHGRASKAIGIAFDGTGCGPDGDLWGGEILVADLSGFRRIGHLRPIALAGGEAAIREPWRLAVAALRDAGLPVEPYVRAPAARRDAVARLLERGFACPPATGAGRWFDAFAALLGVRDEVTYEGQAAVELEALAAGHEEEAPYPFAVQGVGDARPFVIDLRPAVRAAVRDVDGAAPRGRIAGALHATLAAAVLEGARRARRAFDLHTVALSGGCFQSRLLTERAAACLREDGFEVLLHARVPPNDGGVALGQAAVAAFRSRERRGDADVSRHPG